MLTASIYTNAMYKGCSNNGISDRCSQVTIVNANGPIGFPHADAPAVILTMREIGGRKLLTFYPAIEKDGQWVQDPRWFMMGGSYIATSDSRLGELCDKLGVPFYGAIAFHDRYEG